MGEETEKRSEGGEWETKAREWVSSLPKGHTLTATEVENWVLSNPSLLPDDLKALSQSELLQRFTALQSSPQPQTKEAKEVNDYPFRFQRTDRWRPVYTWLESLDLDEVVQSKDISDWLAANPKIYEQLCSRHSRYHLMHYIKKCLFKILKKRKGENQRQNEATPVKVDYVDAPILSAAFPSGELSIVPKENDLYRVKREEASRKYDILVELEKQLAAIIPKQNAAEN